MLQSLHIKNVAVISETEIEFGKGLHVLTGETGAGKSILVDSINMILGERTTKDIIRHGTDKATVVAFFSGVRTQTIKELEELGFEQEEDTILFQRTLSNDKASTARINGTLSAMGAMKELSKNLVNIHGQHDSQSLFQKSYHLQYVDKLSSNSKEKQEYVVQFKKLKSIRSELLELQMNEDEKNERIEFLKHEISEIEGANVKVGERSKLNARKSIILNSEKIAHNAEKAYEILNGDEAEDLAGVIQGLNESAFLVDEYSEISETLKNSAATLKEISFKAQEVARDVSNVVREVDFNPLELEELEERLNVLYQLSEKYGKTEEEIMQYQENSRQELEAIESAEKRLLMLNNEYGHQFDKVSSLADKLSKKRKVGATEMEKNITAELAFLNMPNIEFVVQFEKTNLSMKGYDEVEFLISTNPGQPPKPLIKVASGGELSRIMLAIKTVIADQDVTNTLIFDEIDTGISGRAALKVAQKLKQLSEKRQVICVTHLAQIAAFADNHYSIEKEVRDGQTHTSVRLLDETGRKEELARIIGGTNKATQAQIDSADELLTMAKESS